MRNRWLSAILALAATCAHAQAYVYTSVTPPTVGLFVDTFARVIADQGANTAQPLLVITPDFTVQVMYSDQTSGTTMQASSYNGGTQHTANFASRPAVGVWFYLWCAVVSTGANGVTCGWEYAALNTAPVTVSFQLDTPPTDIAGLYFGYRAGGSYIEADFSGARLYTNNFAGVTGQYKWNAFNYCTFQPGSLEGYWPMNGNTVAQSLKDYSGQGHNLTQVGTLAIETAAPALPQFGRETC